MTSEPNMSNNGSRKTVIIIKSCKPLKELLHIYHNLGRFHNLFINVLELERQYTNEPQDNEVLYNFILHEAGMEKEKKKEELEARITQLDFEILELIDKIGKCIMNTITKTKNYESRDSLMRDLKSSKNVNYQGLGNLEDGCFFAILQSKYKLICKVDSLFYNIRCPRTLERSRSLSEAKRRLNDQPISNLLYEFSSLKEKYKRLLEKYKKKFTKKNVFEDGFGNNMMQNKKYVFIYNKIAYIV